MPYYTAEDHQFLIDTYFMSERLLKLDVLWTYNVGALEQQPEGRQALIATGREMSDLLGQVQDRIRRVYSITDPVSDDEIRGLPNNEQFDILVRQQPSLSRSDRQSIVENYRAARGFIDNLPRAFQDEQEILNGKIARLEAGERLQEGDLRPFARKLLLCLGLVAGVALAVAAPHVALAGAVAHGLHLAWKGAKVLCQAVDVADLVLGYETQIRAD